MWRISFFLFLVSLTITYSEAKPLKRDIDATIRANKVAWQLINKGDYASAMKLVKNTLKHAKLLLGKEHHLTLNTIDALAVLYQTQRQHNLALSLVKQNLAIRERTLGKDHADVGFNLDDLASHYSQRGLYILAEPLYKRSIAIGQKAFRKNGPLLASRMNRLANLYRIQKRYAEAEPLFKRSLAIRENYYDKSHSLVGRTLNDLALLYHQMGRSVEAEPLYKRSLTISEKQHGRDDLIVATTLNNLAGAYRNLGRFAEAEPLYKRSLDIRKRKQGKDHERVGQSYNNLALLYYKQGRFTEAETLFKQSLDIIKRKQGKNHRRVGQVLHNLAELYSAQRRFTEAEPLYKKSIQILEKAFGRDHHDVCKSLKKLAKLYLKLKRPVDEKKLRQRIALMPAKGARHVPLYVVTNRTSSEKGQFTPNLSKTFSLYRVVMSVPSSEIKKLGKRRAENAVLENTKQGDLTKADLLKLVRVKKLKSLKTYAVSAKASQVRASIFKNQALVFVHGFNNSFEGSMKRAAQLGFDLQFDGLIIPFAWPSQSKVTAYLKDGKVASKSVEPLVSFLNQLRDKLPDIKLHFLAHSMGNQIMLKALCNIAKRNDKKYHNFGQVIAAHADTSHQAFEKLTKCFKSHVEGITLYVNEKDTALGVRCAGYQCRAGNKVRDYSSVDVIDTTAMSTGFLKSLSKGFDHDIFIRNPLLFGDITKLILTGTRPVHDRTREFFKRRGPNGGWYWVYNEK